MSFWRQLKWRIVGAHMVVVVVGVTLVLVMAYLATQFVVPASVAQRVEEVTHSTGAAEFDPQALSAATAELLDTFRQSIFTSVLVAAAGAVLAGILSSFLLAREILRPLRQIAVSSQRIAAGHFDERIPEPSSDELALVATNFNQMAEALAHVEQTRVTLIGDVSHELRTPLTSLEGYLEGMLDGVFPMSGETVALMYQQVRRMRRLVDDLQTLSRVEAGQISLHLEAFDVRAVIERVIAQLQPQIVGQSLRIEADLPETAVVVYADQDRTAQVLLNLLGNAMRYTSENDLITAYVTAGKRFATIAVRDTGAGIAAEDLPFLFERFYRVDRSRTRKSGGSGIGLTISRHLVWSMGGELTASSDGPGQGSTFSFTLPLAVHGNVKRET